MADPVPAFDLDRVIAGPTALTLLLRSKTCVLTASLCGLAFGVESLLGRYESLWITCWACALGLMLTAGLLLNQWYAWAARREADAGYTTVASVWRRNPDLYLLDLRGRRVLREPPTGPFEPDPIGLASTRPGLRIPLRPLAVAQFVVWVAMIGLFASILSAVRSGRDLSGHPSSPTLSHRMAEQRIEVFSDAGTVTCNGGRHIPLTLGARFTCVSTTGSVYTATITDVDRGLFTVG